MPSGQEVRRNGRSKPKLPGSTTVRLKRWRPWEGDKSVVERYDVTIDVSS